MSTYSDTTLYELNAAVESYNVARAAYDATDARATDRGPTGLPRTTAAHRAAGAELDAAATNLRAARVAYDAR